MMKKMWMVIVGVLLVSGFVLDAGAAPFQPLFQVTAFEPKCEVQPPGAKMQNAERNRAYPYGTRVRTDRRGSCTILLSDPNTLQLAANTTVVLGEDPADATRKIADVESGNLQCELEAGYQDANRLHVRTPVATTEMLTGGMLTVDVMVDVDVDVAHVTCNTAGAVVAGPNFALRALEEGDVATIETAKDDTYTRIETAEGAFEVEVKDAEGNPKVVPTQKGSVVKIWRRPSETGKMLIVTILISGPNGDIIEGSTYMEEMPEPMEEPEPEPEPEREPEREPEEPEREPDEEEETPQRPEDWPEWPEIETDTTTTTTTTTTRPIVIVTVDGDVTIPTPTQPRRRRRTTTTTQPSPTPVGLR